MAAVSRRWVDAIATHPAANYGAVVVLGPTTARCGRWQPIPPMILPSGPAAPDSAQAISALLNDPNQPLLNRATQEPTRPDRRSNW